MSLTNLVKSNQLEPHPFDAAECDKLLAGARRVLLDAHRTPGHHALVIQLLETTLGLPSARWRELDLYRRKRNLVDYSGDLIDEATAESCVAAAQRLLEEVEKRLAAGP